MVEAFSSQPPPQDATPDFWAKVNGVYEIRQVQEFSLIRLNTLLNTQLRVQVLLLFLVIQKKMAALAEEGKPTCAHYIKGNIVRYSQRRLWSGNSTLFYLETEIKEGKTIYYKRDLEKAEETEQSILGRAKRVCRRTSFSVLPFGVKSITLLHYDQNSIEFGLPGKESTSTEAIAGDPSNQSLLVFTHVQNPKDLAVPDYDSKMQK